MIQVTCDRLPRGGANAMLPPTLERYVFFSFDTILIQYWYNIDTVFCFYHSQVIKELVWCEKTYPIPTRHFSVRLLKSSSNWTKLSMMGPQLFSGWYQMILDVFWCSQQFSDVFPLFSDVFRLFSDDVFWLLKSSSSWTKLSMMGPQLFPG